jgi:hypothetical protein
VTYPEDLEGKDGYVSLGSVHGCGAWVSRLQASAVFFLAGNMLEPWFQENHCILYLELEISLMMFNGCLMVV